MRSMILIVLVFFVVFVSELASANSPGWRELDGRDFELASGGERCSDGTFFFIDEGSQQTLRLGHSIDMTFNPKKQVTSIVDIGKDSRCRYDAKIKPSAYEIRSTTKVSGCSEGAYTVNEILRLKPDGMLEYLNEEISRSGKKERYSCRFRALPKSSK